jgi:hypothetical protein
VKAKAESGVRVYREYETLGPAWVDRLRSMLVEVSTQWTEAKTLERCRVTVPAPKGRVSLGMLDRNLPGVMKLEDRDARGDGTRERAKCRWVRLWLTTADFQYVHLGHVRLGVSGLLEGIHDMIHVDHRRRLATQSESAIHISGSHLDEHTPPANGTHTLSSARYLSPDQGSASSAL